MNLPCYDCFITIFNYLDYLNYKKLCLVCSEWRHIIHNGTFYGNFLKEIEGRKFRNIKMVFYHFISERKWELAHRVFADNYVEINIMYDVSELNLANNDFDTIKHLLAIQKADLTDYSFLNEQNYYKYFLPILTILYYDKEYCIPVRYYGIQNRNLKIRPSSRKFSNKKTLLKLFDKNKFNYHNVIPNLELVKLTHILGYSIDAEYYFSTFFSCGNLDGIKWIYSLNPRLFSIDELKSYLAVSRKVKYDHIYQWFQSIL
jgi:hypothetical protein